MGVKFIGKSAFDAIYDANADKVYRTALYYSDNHHIAEEITQNVFMNFYVCMDNVSMDSVSNWLITAAKNMALNYVRTQKREVLTYDITDEYGEYLTTESIEEELLKAFSQKENYEFLEEMLEGLYQENERWYYAWTLTRILDKPDKEVAQIMGISYDNLRKILSRTNKWIERHYERQYEHLKDLNKA